MATFKHISSKNADYGAAEQYLTFEHDEFTMKPTLDEAGRLVPRENYRIATLNCGEEDFAVACMRSNLRYGKNQKREDVKSHHYIISLIFSIVVSIKLPIGCSIAILLFQQYLYQSFLTSARSLIPLIPCLTARPISRNAKILAAKSKLISVSAFSEKFGFMSTP